MNKSWRPGGWENPYCETTVEKVNKMYPNGIPKGYHILLKMGRNEGFEAGADAMLEALKNQPDKIGGDVLYVDELADSSTFIHNPHRKGWLVFIPDEEAR